MAADRWHLRNRETRSIAARGDAATAVNGHLPQLERLIHERIRLGIISALAVREQLSFNELKKLLKTSDGNLSVHARKLEEAGYIECTKFFEDRIPRTEYRLTSAGRGALERYLSRMETLIQSMKRGKGKTSV